MLEHVGSHLRGADSDKLPPIPLSIFGDLGILTEERKKTISFLCLGRFQKYAGDREISGGGLASCSFIRSLVLTERPFFKALHGPNGGVRTCWNRRGEVQSAITWRVGFPGGVVSLLSQLSDRWH